MIRSVSLAFPYILRDNTKFCHSVSHSFDLSRLEECSFKVLHLAVGQGSNVKGCANNYDDYSNFKVGTSGLTPGCVVHHKLDLKQSGVYCLVW